MINLTIKTLDSQDHKFRVPDTFTILELKEHIAEQVNIAVCQQRLIFCGRVMSNETKLADIGIDGKVMHLVQKVPRLATTTSGTTSSTTTNTNSRSGQNGGPGFRGWHTHDPTVLFGAIGIPSEFMHAGELPRLLSASARSHGAGNRVALAIDMIRRANEVLNRLENPQTAGRSTANDGEQLPEESQQTEESSRNVPLEPSLQESPVQESPAQESASQEPSSIPTQSDSDSLNVSYEVDETFPNTVVVTIDATHHMRMPPGLMRHMQSHMQGNNSHSPSQNLTEHTVESEVIPELITVGSSNQPSADQATRTSSANSEQNVRNDRQTSERSSAAINDRRRLRELIEQLNSLNARLQPFYAQYCQYINDDPHFETTIGDNGSQRAQIVFNGVSEVMHFISHIYHAISDLRVAFNRPPPRSFQSRPCLLQGTILHTAHSVTTTTSNAAPSPAPSSQQPTSTQTTTTNQSIPSVRALRVDFMNPEGVVRNVSTSATSTETNTNMTVDPNTDNNSTATEFSSETPHGVELMFDLTPGSIRIDSVEAAFVNPNASGSSQPTAVSQPQSGGEHSNNTPMQSIDWMDQMIDVISSGVRRPFMPDQPVDWSIPTTSTRTPRVTPRTTDSSSTTNPPSQGLSRGRWDSSPRMDPFLPCSSHHFESNVRPMVLARRSPQMTDRSTSGNASTTDTSSPTPPNVTRTNIRRPTERILERHRARYMQDSEGFLSGIHPILTWGRNHRNNTATTPASNNVPTTGQSNVADALAGQIRVDMESVLDTLGREVDFERVTRSNMQPPSSSGSDSSVSPVNQSGRRPDEMLMTSIGDIPYFRSLEGRYVLVDLFLLITRNWTLHDMLNLCTSELSTLRQHPVSRISESLVDFVLDRVMINQPPTNLNIEAAANRIYLEMVPYINIFQCSVPTRTNIDVNASFRQCILLNMRALVNFCDENRAGASNDIVAAFTIFAEGVLSLIVYCCNNRSVFRLCIAAVMQFLPLPANLHRFVMELVRQNIDQYWDNMTTFQMMSLSVIDFIVPFNTELESGQSSRGTNDEHSSQSSQSSSPILPSPDNINEPLPEVVIGSQEWHHSVPSEWVPVIARDSQRQRRQGTQPPYSDAYLSGMPNKRRKIVTSSKPQGSLPQMIASSLENAMGAAGVVVKKELTKSVGADTAVQNAYTERVRKCGRSGLDMHPDFCPDRYPNASKFFYNRPN